MRKHHNHIFPTEYILECQQWGKNFNAPNDKQSCHYSVLNPGWPSLGYFEEGLQNEDQGIIEVFQFQFSINVEEMESNGNEETAGTLEHPF